MNLHDLISRDAPFVGPCCTYFPIDYRISYENTPVLSVRWKDLDPLNIQLLDDGNGLGADGFKIRFAYLDDLKDFKNLLAGILFWPLTCREYCVG